MKYWVSALTFAVVMLGIGYLNLYCCEMEFNSNSAGVIISALGVLVTALVGWQVYNAIEMKSTIARVDEVKAELDRLATQHRDKILRLEWLASALHGTTFERKTFEGGDTAYFIHCLDVIGNFVKSGASFDSPPFKNTLDNLESTLHDIVVNHNSHQIMILGAEKDFVWNWYLMVIKIIDTEVQHLESLKTRLSKVYEDYLVLTKDVVVTPRKASSRTSQNSCHILDALRRFINKLKLTK